LGFKGQRHRVSKFILHTRILRIRTAIHRHSLGNVTSRQRGFEIGIKCLLVSMLYSVCEMCNILAVCYPCIIHRDQVLVRGGLFDAFAFSYGGVNTAWMGDR